MVRPVKDARGSGSAQNSLCTKGMMEIFSENLVNNASWSLKVAIPGCLKLPIEYTWELPGFHPVAYPAHTAIPDVAGDTEEKPVFFQRTEV